MACKILFRICTRCFNSHFPGKCGLASCQLHTLHWNLTCAYSQNMTKLSYFTDTSRLPCAYPLSSSTRLHHHTLETIGITFMFNMSIQSQCTFLNHQADWLQSAFGCSILRALHVFLPFFVKFYSSNHKCFCSQDLTGNNYGNVDELDKKL